MTIQSEIRPVDDFRPHPMNARRHADDEIRESLREFGQYKPVVVSIVTGYVVAGHGLLAALKAEGWSNCWFALVPDLTEADELRLVAKDNTTQDHGRYDDEKLADLLGAIQEDRQGLAGTGWKDKDRDKLLTRLRSGAEKTADLFATAGKPEGEPEDEEHRATGAQVPKRAATVLRFPLTPEGAREIAGYLDELRARWEIEPDGAIIHEALRRAVSRSNA